jgi:MFS-type transporter involved in bile tolerance (Atg22 family)
MNKTIFQMGLLAFCVAAVVYGIQGVGLIETLARSFLVFTIVVCVLALAVIVAVYVVAGSRPRPGRPATPGNAPGHNEQSASSVS